MKINKILIFMFLFFGLVSYVSAVLNDGLIYGSHLNDLTDNDWSGNSNIMTFTGTSLTTDKNNQINQAMIMGANDIAARSENLLTGNAMTYSIWVNRSSSGFNTYFAQGNSNSDRSITTYLSSGIFNLGISTATAGAFDYTYVSNSIFTENLVWTHIVVTRDGTTHKLYKNGVEQTFTLSGSVNSNNFRQPTSPLTKLKYNDPSDSETMDEARLWDRALNQTEITELYGLYDQEGYTPTLTFINITADNTTLVNNSFYNDTIQFQTFIINTSTNGNVNHSYSLNGASLVKYCTNQLNCSANLNLSEDNYNISFYAENNETNVSSSNFSFTVDKTTPIINNSIPLEINNYNFLDTYFSCNDTNLLSCNISINGFNKAQGINFTLIHNGNATYNITAIDLAGNSLVESGVILVNPFQYFRFVDDLGNNVTNYTFNGVDFIDLATLKIYDIGLGNQSLSFEKDGYITSNFPIIFNTTSEYNITYNVSVARIIVNVFNQLTGSLLTNQTLFLDLIGPTTLFTNSTTGIFNLSSFLIAGPYQVFVTTTNFQAVQNNFIFNGTGNKIINLYMLPTNTSLVGFVNIITYKEDNTFYSEIPVKAFEWDSSTNTYIQTYEIFSNTNGLAVVPVILNDKIYKFCADYPSGETCFPTSILGVTISTSQNGETFPILPSRDFPSIPLDLGVLQITINNLNLTNFSDSYYNYLVDYSWENIQGLTSTVCTKIEKDFNFSTSIIVDTCSSSANGFYLNNFLLNKSFSYIFTIYSVDGTVEKVEFTQNIRGIETFFKYLERFNVLKILQILIVVLMIGIIPYIKIPLLIIIDIIGAFIISWKYLIPQDLSIISVGVIIILCIVTLMAVNKK